jgi:hypothetical protein
MPMPLGRHTFRLNPNSLFKDGTGPGLEPVGGEFQPSFETVHPGGGAYRNSFTLFSESPYSVLFFVFYIIPQGKNPMIQAGLSF